jgi:MFS family permease
MNPSLIWIALALFTWGIGEGMFFIFQPIYMEKLGADPLLIGYIMGGFGLAMAITHTPAGHLADRIGRRPMLTFAWASGLLATIVMGFATTLPVFVVGWLMYGITAFVSSPLNSYITAARGNWSVGRALTSISVAFNLGMALGPVIGGLIGERFELRTVFFVAAGLFVLSNIFLHRIADQPINQHDDANPPANLLANTRFVGFVGLGFLIVIATFLPQSLTPNFLQNVRGLNLEQIGQIGSVGNFGNAALAFILGQLEARIGFILGQACVAIFSIIMWQASGTGWYALAYFLLGGYRAMRMLFSAQILPLIHESQMGLAYGTSETILSAAIIVAPIIAGYLYEYDPMLMYPTALIATLVGIVATYFLAPRRQQTGLEQDAA